MNSKERQAQLEKAIGSWYFKGSVKKAEQLLERYNKLHPLLKLYVRVGFKVLEVQRKVKHFFKYNRCLLGYKLGLYQTKHNEEPAGMPQDCWSVCTRCGHNFVRP